MPPYPEIDALADRGAHRTFCHVANYAPAPLSRSLLRLRMEWRRDDRPGGLGTDARPHEKDASESVALWPRPFAKSGQIVGSVSNDRLPHSLRPP